MDADARMAVIEHHFRQASIVLLGLLAVGCFFYSLYRIARSCIVACSEIALYILLLAVSAYGVGLLLRAAVIALDGRAFYDSMLRPIAGAIHVVGIFVNATQAP